MRTIGQRLAHLLQRGDTVLLDGPIGAGKSVLCPGSGARARSDRPRPKRDVRVGLQLPDRYAWSWSTRTPTGTMTRVNISTRLEESYADACILIEWGSKVAGVVADGYLAIVIEPTDLGEGRRLAISTAGDTWAQRIPPWTWCSDHRYPLGQAASLPREHVSARTRPPWRPRRGLSCPGWSGPEQGLGRTTSTSSWERWPATRSSRSAPSSLTSVPGNLATTRACVAYANALAFAMDLRVAGVNSLDVMAVASELPTDGSAVVRVAGPHGFYARLQRDTVQYRAE